MDILHNFPLRGCKISSRESGVRVPGFVTGGYSNDDRKGEILTDIMGHIPDWCMLFNYTYTKHPTILTVTGLKY